MQREGSAQIGVISRGRSHLQGVCERLSERSDGLPHDERAFERDLPIAAFGQQISTIRFRAEEAPDAAVAVQQHQRGVGMFQPHLIQTMGGGVLLLYVVEDEVTGAGEQAIAADRQGMRHERFDEQRVIEQVMCQAVSAEAFDDRLHFVEHARLRPVSRPGAAEAIAHLSERKPADRRAVEIVEELAVQPPTRQGDRLEEALCLDEWVDDLRHDVLRRLQREEGGGGRTGGETGARGNNLPVERDVFAGDAAEGGHARRSAWWQVGTAQRLDVGQGEGALRRQHGDQPGGHAGLDQPQQTDDRCARFARPGSAIDEQSTPIDRVIDERTLAGGKIGIGDHERIFYQKMVVLDMRQAKNRDSLSR